MAKLSPMRRLMKLIHPEGIPWPGSVFYNALSSSTIFMKHYELAAEDILSHCSQGTLLDIGTGPARLLLKLHQQSPGMRLVGIDSSAAMITQAKQNVAQAGMSEFIEIKEGSASRIPFPDQSFDIVVSTVSMHHWKQPEACLNEIYRVLKDNSFALIYDIVSNMPKEILEKFSREIGRLRTFLFWLHGFEEPFYDRRNFASLAQPTLFKQGQTRFVGLLYCLILKK
ncbi:MAG: class I SAM-dependent methyltransferase [Sedimentisphaerales bacterium]|jgi:ubiquinone/menaquinone biosynthesis C-methylase UbiE